MPVGRVRTGVILIAVGVLLLLNSTGVVDFGSWRYIWKLWPVILIAIGVEKIFSATGSLKPLAWLSPIIIVGVVTYAVVAGGRDSGGGWDNWNWNFNNFNDNEPDNAVYLWTESAGPTVKRLDLSMQMAGGRLVLRGGTDSGNAVVGRVNCRCEKPRTTSEETDGVLRVHIEDRDGRGHRDKDQWIVKITDGLPVDLKVEGGAARMRLDLTAVKAEHVTLSAGAADVNVVFGPSVPVVDASIETAVAALDITIPPGAGVQLDRRSAISSFSSGSLNLVEHGDVMETPGYDTRPVKIRLHLNSGISSVRLREGSGAESSI
ncbi:MAG: hypothetical protein HY304_06630 [candidate division Zixibacteria bacterium]|nr:hypothetical protein [candidate division Zixibacteria bacterium]